MRRKQIKTKKDLSTNEHGQKLWTPSSATELRYGSEVTVIHFCDLKQLELENKQRLYFRH